VFCTTNHYFLGPRIVPVHALLQPLQTWFVPSPLQGCTEPGRGGCGPAVLKQSIGSSRGRHLLRCGERLGPGPSLRRAQFATDWPALLERLFADAQVKPDPGADVGEKIQRRPAPVRWTADQRPEFGPSSRRCPPARADLAHFIPPDYPSRCAVPGCERLSSRDGCCALSGDAGLPSAEGALTVCLQRRIRHDLKERAEGTRVKHGSPPIPSRVMTNRGRCSGTTLEPNAGHESVIGPKEGKTKGARSNGANQSAQRRLADLYRRVRSLPAGAN